MRVIIFFIVCILFGCTDSKIDNIPDPIIDYTVIKVENNFANIDISRPSSENKDIDFHIYIVSNDKERLILENDKYIIKAGESSVKIPISLNLSSEIIFERELSLSIYSGDKLYKKIYVAPVMLPNNIKAPLTFDINLKTINFNIIDKLSSLVYEVMDINNKLKTNFIKEYQAGEQQEKFTIYGLYNKHDNFIRLNFIGTDNQRYVQYICVPTIDALSTETYKVDFNIIKSDMSKVYPEFLFLTGQSIGYNLILDKQGNIRGKYNFAETEGGFVGKYLHGRLEFSINYSDNLIFMGLNGVEQDRIVFSKLKNLPVGIKYQLHHDFIPIYSGKYKGMYAMLANKLPGDTVEDIVVIFDPVNKTFIKEIDFKKLLPHKIRFPEGAGEFGLKDWFHANSIFHDESDDSFIISSRHQGVIKIVENNGIFEIKWILTPHINFTDEDNQKYNIYSKLLKPIDSNGVLINDMDILQGYKAGNDFEWNFMQHSAIKIDNGNIIIYDNGAGRFHQKIGDIIGDGYSRYVEYKINEENMTVQQVYQFGKEYPEYYSQIMSNVGKLSNGNIYMSSVNQREKAGDDTSSRYIEIDPVTNNIVLEIQEKKSKDSPKGRWLNYRIYNVDLSN